MFKISQKGAAAMAAKKNEVYPLRIEGYGSAGEGVARLDGQAVFVKGALAGELCQVQLLKVGKSAAWGRVANILCLRLQQKGPPEPHLLFLHNF
jgi:23S rRNA (uracil1939-C5)-methyltransferase